MWEEDFVQILTHQFELIKQKNANYSLRAFAKKIKISTPTLSLLLRGKQKISKDRAFDILAQLNINKNQLSRLLIKMGRVYQLKMSQWADDNYSLLLNHDLLAVLFCFDLQVGHDVAAICKRLNLSESQVNFYIDCLIQKNLLTKAADGTVCRTDIPWATTDGISNEMIQKHHQINLLCAEKALMQIPLQERDFTSMIFAGNKEQLESFRMEIRRLYEKMTTMMMNTEPRNELYQMTVSLFPVVKKDQ